MFIYRFQLRGSQILDAVRLHKTGFPESLGFGEFWRKFHLLSEEEGASSAKRSNRTPPAPSEMRGAVEELLQNMEMDKSMVRMGNTQVRRGRSCKLIFFSRI